MRYLTRRRKKYRPRGALPKSTRVRFRSDGLKRKGRFDAEGVIMKCLGGPSVEMAMYWIKNSNGAPVIRCAHEIRVAE